MTKPLPKTKAHPLLGNQLGRVCLAAFMLLVLTRLAVGQSLSELAGQELAWDALPEELVAVCTPESEVSLEIGATSAGDDYLAVLPEKGLLNLRVRCPGDQAVPYLVKGRKAYYWPINGILRVEGEVTVSSAGVAELAGKELDVLLTHDTLRLIGPEKLTVEGTSQPIRSNSVRVAGVGTGGPIILEWDETPPTPTPVPTREPTPLPANPVTELVAVELNQQGKMLFGNRPCKPSELETCLEGISTPAERVSFAIRHPRDVSAKLVDSISRTIRAAGYDRIKIEVTDPVPTKASSLAPPPANPYRDEPDTSVPVTSGARLLWVAAPGEFLLNGKSFDEPSLRQTLRRLVTRSGNVPMILAQPEGRNPDTLTELARDLEAYGFANIQVSRPVKN